MQHAAVLLPVQQPCPVPSWSFLEAVAPAVPVACFGAASKPCAVCRLLECYAAQPVPLQAQQRQAALAVLDESVRSPAPEIQAAAIETLGPFARSYLASLPAEVLGGLV